MIYSRMGKFGIMAFCFAFDCGDCPGDSPGEPGRERVDLKVGTKLVGAASPE
jgi:hypothetical protein